MGDPECPYSFAPLPENKRDCCVPLRGRVHPQNSFIFNCGGRARLVRLRKGASLPKDAPPEDALDFYPRADQWNSAPKGK